MPACLGTARGSVFTSRATTPARRAFVIHVLLPLTTYSSPSRTAVVRIDCRSDPPPGSVSAIAALISPVAILGSSRVRCSSVPNVKMSLAMTLCPPIAPARLIQPRASSWVIRT